MSEDRSKTSQQKKSIFKRIFLLGNEEVITQDIAGPLSPIREKVSDINQNSIESPNASQRTEKQTMITRVNENPNETTKLDFGCHLLERQISSHNSMFNTQLNSETKAVSHDNLLTLLVPQQPQQLSQSTVSISEITRQARNIKSMSKLKKYIALTLLDDSF